MPPGLPSTWTRTGTWNCGVATSSASRAAPTVSPRWKLRPRCWRKWLAFDRRFRSAMIFADDCGGGTAMARPFEGIRVIDLTHVLAGPFATYQLAVLGADVIKIEHPDDPDQSRSTGTDRALNRAQLGTAFLAQASNKRAITLDLKSERDRSILKKLVATADVF